MANNYAIETQGLTKEFRGFRAVEDVNLRVKTGTIHAVIGPNGAGKSTVFNLVSKFLEPSSGKILFNGQDITKDRPAKLARSGLVRSFQISAVFPELTALENVRMARLRKHGKPFQFWRSTATLRTLHDDCHTLLEQVGLSDYVDTRAGSLSYGRKRALELATTLALDPEVMLLDEPMAGLGREDIERISGLIRRAAAGRTVLMVEHNMNVIAALSDTITVLQRGAVLVEGDYQTVANDPRVIEAYTGTANQGVVVNG